MPEQFLDRSNVLSGFKQMSRETVPKSMASNFFGDTCPTDGISDLLLDGTFMNMVTPQLGYIIVRNMLAATFRSTASIVKKALISLLSSLAG